MSTPPKSKEGRPPVSFNSSAWPILPCSSSSCGSFSASSSSRFSHEAMHPVTLCRIRRKRAPNSSESHRPCINPTPHFRYITSHCVHGSPSTAAVSSLKEPCSTIPHDRMRSGIPLVEEGRQGKDEIASSSHYLSSTSPYMNEWTERP